MFQIKLTKRGHCFSFHNFHDKLFLTFKFLIHKGYIERARSLAKSHLETLIKQVLGRTNRLLSLIRHGQHWKRRVQQFFYCYVCIRYHCNVSTEPLPSNDRGVHIQTHVLMGGIPLLGRWDGLRCRDIRTKFHKDWFRHLKVNWGTHGQQRDLISYFIFFNKWSRLKTNFLTL
jgi:hypothetical protein